jgi:uncharacterized membrane protein YcaP (DUF421 family)
MHARACIVAHSDSSLDWDLPDVYLMVDWLWLTTSISSAAMVVAKAIGIYLVLIGFTRLAGLRSFSKMSSFDFAVTVAFGSLLASTVLTKTPPLSQAIVALAALFLIQYTVSQLRIRSSAVVQAVDNDPEIIMFGSEILEENMKSVRMTKDDLYAKLREANVTRLDQVRAVVVESTGDVSVLHEDPDAPPIDAEVLYGIQNREAYTESTPLA